MYVMSYPNFRLFFRSLGEASNTEEPHKTQTPKYKTTGFYPSLKSFWSCFHMNCCQHYMLHINLHILYIYFHQVQFKFDRISRTQQLLQKLSSEQG